MQSAKDPLHAINFQAEVISRTVPIDNDLFASLCSQVVNTEQTWPHV